MASSPSVRLPGVSFLAAPRGPGGVLPPRDVAAFVGFAERGALDTPVALEEPGEFTAHFGGGLVLARQANGELLRAQLGDTVRAFFANGGRRCYVVRIAGAAATRARWSVPGLVRQKVGGAAQIEASSEGAWAQKIRLATRLVPQFLPASAFFDGQWIEGKFVVEWDTGGVASTILPNDLLRFQVKIGTDIHSWLYLPTEVTSLVGRSANIRQLSGVGFFEQPVVPFTVQSVERLRFDLVLQEQNQPLQVLSDRAFCGPHARFWGNGGGSLAPLPPELQGEVYLPEKMPAALDENAFVLPSVSGTDDLETYPLERFLDPWLAARNENAAGLWQSGQDRVYLQNSTLKGLHSLMFVEEVGLIALPDAGHLAWQRERREPPVVPPPPLPVPPDRSRFDHGCAPEPTPPVVAPAPVSASEPLLPLVQEDTIFGTLEQPPQEDPVVALRHSVFLKVQTELVKLCEARADALAVLSLPLSYERRHCLMWQRALKEQLSAGSDRSYGALYHPWVTIAEGGKLKEIPPDGVVCGMIAARERARGVWIAPANIPLIGVLGLSPKLSEEDRAELFEAGLNILHTEPRDFRAMSAHTLSDDPTLLQISVRRLMIVLRKMLFERGHDYVFENHNPHFQEAVRLSLETVLRGLHQRGAFAGSTAQGAYQVITDARVNSPQSRDAGQFIVEVRVAPSQPAEFLTVRLVRTGESALTLTEQ